MSPSENYKDSPPLVIPWDIVDVAFLVFDLLVKVFKTLLASKAVSWLLSRSNWYSSRQGQISFVRIEVMFLSVLSNWLRRLGIIIDLFSTLRAGLIFRLMDFAKSTFMFSISLWAETPFALLSATFPPLIKSLMNVFARLWVSSFAGYVREKILQTNFSNSTSPTSVVFMPVCRLESFPMN